MSNGKKILVVEDEEAMAKVLALKLQNRNFEVKIAYDGAEALEIVKNENFDIIILDLMMPEKDGFSFLEDIRNQNNQTRVVVLTNLNQNEDVERAKSLGVMAYFPKVDTPIAAVVNYVTQILMN